MLLEIIGAILSMVGSWMIFKKMGRQGWEGIVPIYSTYVLCKVLYGNGWKFLLLLIPFYNIYFAIKMMVDLAKAFNQGVGFAIGLLLLPFVFNLILATALKEKRAFIEEQRQSNAQVVPRIEDAAAAMAQASTHISEWDEALIRQLVDTVKVNSAKKITVFLRGGIQVEQGMI